MITKTNNNKYETENYTILDIVIDKNIHFGDNVKFIFFHSFLI